MRWGEFEAKVEAEVEVEGKRLRLLLLRGSCGSVETTNHQPLTTNYRQRLRLRKGKGLRG
jgi:hypothetical protein